MASYPYWDYKTQSWRKMKVPSGKGRGLDIFGPRGNYRFDEAVKRQLIERPARRKRKVTAQQVRAEVVQKIGTAKTFRELKVRTYKALRLLEESLPQVFVCRVRARRRKARPKHGR